MDIPTFDTILELVESHGEPSRCQVEDCEKCKQIVFAREYYLGEDFKQVKRAQYIYTVIDERGKQRQFYVKSDIRKLLRCSDNRLSEAIKTGMSINGYAVFRDKV